MTQITEPMLHAARAKAEELVLEHFRFPGDPGSFHGVVEDMAIRIVVAALAAAPVDEADPVVAFCATTAVDEDFTKALDALLEAADPCGIYRAFPINETDSDQRAAARREVERLYAQARNAGLRELREWIETDPETVPEEKRGVAHLLATAGMNHVKVKIDAMLREATDE